MVTKACLRSKEMLITCLPALLPYQIALKRSHVHWDDEVNYVDLW